MTQKTLKMLINGKLTHVKLDKPLEPAHGPGLDGVTPVASFNVGNARGYPGKKLVQDDHGNTIMGTSDELLAALRKAEPGYEFTAIKK